MNYPTTLFIYKNIAKTYNKHNIAKNINVLTAYLLFYAIFLCKNLARPNSSYLQHEYAK
ncbi:hypothetical protein U3516DRAFT_760183 [Neocallimastix sp. 'constans']